MLFGTPYYTGVMCSDCGSTMRTTWSIPGERTSFLCENPLCNTAVTFNLRPAVKPPAGEWLWRLIWWAGHGFEPAKA